MNSRVWHVAKKLLVSGLTASMHEGALRVARALSDAAALVGELQDFRAAFSDSGFARFGAREGAHDDLVLAVALGVWWARQPRQATGVFKHKF